MGRKPGNRFVRGLGNPEISSESTAAGLVPGPARNWSLHYQTAFPFHTNILLRTNSLSRPKILFRTIPPRAAGATSRSSHSLLARFPASRPEISTYHFSYILFVLCMYTIIMIIIVFCFIVFSISYVFKTKLKQILDYFFPS